MREIILFDNPHTSYLVSENAGTLEDGHIFWRPIGLIIKDFDKGWRAFNAETGKLSELYDKPIDAAEKEFDGQLIDK